MVGFEDITWTHLEQVLKEYGEYFISLARADLDANGTNATMALYDSMKTYVIIGDSSYKVDIDLKYYWYYVEHGRRPGKFPPRNKIKEWIQVKHIIPKQGKTTRRWRLKDGTERTKEVTYMPTVDQLAFLISRKIATKGTDPQPFFEKNIKPTYDHFKDIIEEAIRLDISEYIERQVRGRIERYLYRWFS